MCKQRFHVSAIYQYHSMSHSGSYVIKKAAFIMIILITAIFVYAAIQPDTFRIDRSIQ